MNREQVLEHLCVTMAMVYRSIGDYSQPSDGFCHRCPHGNDPTFFQHNGQTLEWIRQAVVERLEREGIPLAEGFDPVKGEK